MGDAPRAMAGELVDPANSSPGRHQALWGGPPAPISSFRFLETRIEFAQIDDIWAQLEKIKRGRLWQNLSSFCMAAAIGAGANEAGAAAGKSFAKVGGLADP